ncbi:MAG: glycosyltransferase family 2 protein [Acidobacteria bacterium]|nr:glycosyltransferase family 2 protein [Acidobacteriota bacterium]
MKAVGVAIVAYNCEGVIGDCLDACLARGLSRIAVIDNASSDATRETVLQRPGVQLVANASNRGFAGGVNQAMKLLETPVVLVLNPDAVLLDRIDALVTELADPHVGAAAGLLQDADGKAQMGFTVRRFPTPAALSLEALGWNRLFPGNPVNRNYRCLGLSLDSVSDVEQPAGAFLLIRREAWQRIGGFDERFEPVWFEDVDFCLRLHRSGYRIRLVPGVRAQHAGGHSVARMSSKCQQLYWYGSLLRYAAKHFRPAGKRAVCAAVVVGSVPRMLLGALRQRSLEPLAVFGNVIRLAGRCLVSGRVQEIGVSREIGAAVG